MPRSDKIELSETAANFIELAEAESRLTGNLYLRGVLNDKIKKPSATKMEAAKALLPYELPKLSQVEAVQKNIEMSHEDWLASLKDDGDE